MRYATREKWAKRRRHLLWLALVQGMTVYAQSQPDGQPEAAAAAPAASQADQQDAAALAAKGKKGKADSTQLETVTVTAQKKVENITKVPIAISAFGGEDLNDRKIETGGDLVTAVPNVSFTKTNFASYNFQIRGIGTQALSVTTDPAVAVSFNSAPMIRNRLFEQEYFDVDRVEVLRGPQGTLYGRNATAGVVNMIPNLPNFDGFESWVKGELGNYDSRRFSGMINVPLSDTLAFRAAGAWTDRSGYDYNSVTKQDVNDRNLWSSRLSLAWKPTDGISTNLIWEHFNEDDDRSRTGKQLCHNDPGPAAFGDTTIPQENRGYLSQGCQDGSLYSPGAFGTVNGASLPYTQALGTFAGLLGFDPTTFTAIPAVTLGVDPFSGFRQSRDLRRIATTYDPHFKAKNDVVQFNFNAEVGQNLNFVSQTLFTRDRYYSTQDYSRFPSNPVFNAGDGLVGFDPTIPAYNLTPKGVFCDPQLGCSDRLLVVDLVQAYSKQWSQEFRLQSDYDGAFNFSVGANSLYFNIDESYYVFSNAFTMIAQNYFNSFMQLDPPFSGPPVNCVPGQTVPTGLGYTSCVYIDPNRIGNINGQGHNYFRSRNLAKTFSNAIFGETYWQLSDTLKLTAGLRLTQDRKITTPVPSQLLLAPGDFGGGFVNSGYPERANIHQKWTEPTGRVVLDWTPQTSFTDSTLVYASISRGYKAGGTNSPGIDANPALGFVTRDARFQPEFVNAFELGTKNVFAGGKFSLNATLFYNNYKDYQVSQIQDRATLNENFDAKTWGMELEAIWKPTQAFQLSGNLGLLGTRIGSGQSSIDVMNRTQGNPDWVLVKPWIQQSSNCIAPRALVEQLFRYFAENGQGNPAAVLTGFCPGATPVGGPAVLSVYGIDWNPLRDAPNGGAGFAADVGGNSLPNAPHVTISLSPQYTFFSPHGDWILRADMYYQTKSWARVYQDEIDRLRGWGNVNLSLTYQKLEDDLTVQLYVKNVLNGHAITGTFLNSDDSGLTSNVFLQDPRIIGVSIRKGFY